MKSPAWKSPSASAGFSRNAGRLRFLSAAAALFTATAAAGTGELDRTFEPVAEELEGRTRFTVVGDACYGYWALSPEIRRYGDNGRWDGTPIVIPPTSFGGSPSLTWVVALPWGGLWAGGLSSPHAVDPAGRIFPLATPGARSLNEKLAFFPLDDGGWVTPDLARFDANGVRDSAFARACWLKFGPPNGRPQVGQVLRDGQGRLVAIGNFLQSGPEVRLGIVRVLPDGRPDPVFDPAEALGIKLTDEGVLSGQPRAIALAPDDSVLVEISRLGPDDVWQRGLAQLDDRGNVFRWVELDPDANLLPPVVQPDGRILLGGIFDHWLGRPATSLIRLLPEGGVDSSFHVELGRSGSTRAGLEGMTLDERGRLWIHGQFDRVNGVPRPGLARVLAYEAPNEPPEIRLTATPPRIATNEVLYLAADVGGAPPPELQWTLDGLPIPGATNRVLRLPVEAGTPLGTFRLAARNAAGVEEREFPPVTLAIRSPHAGQLDPGFDVSLGRLPDPQILLPLPDGGLLITSGFTSEDSELNPMIGRLRPDGTWDDAFGDDGLVWGDGVVQSIVSLPQGGFLIGGRFTRLAGAESRGLLELDPEGNPVLKSWPDFDIPEVTALAWQPDGKLLIAGLFQHLAGQDAYHFARLDAEGHPDPGFRPALEPGQVVEHIQVDSEGRIVISGVRFSGDAPPSDPVRLRRLLPDGTRDPAFGADTQWWLTQFFLQPGDTLMAGFPPQRLDAGGAPLMDFDLVDLSVPGISFPARLGLSLAPLPDGGLVASALRNSVGTLELVRWHSNGDLDTAFQSVIGRRFEGPEVRSLAVMADGTVVFATLTPNTSSVDTAYRLRRLLPDPDTFLGNPRLQDGRLEATLATQPGVAYEFYLRARLDSGSGTRVDGFTGDGYVRTLSVPVAPNEGHQFLEMVRRW
ncbi:MAG: hypothetical protein KIT22_06900 [Verrucomicrobiae bacterium]|nr:hypothetical protein [Verrucomicrobiae bacterium]